MKVNSKPSTVSAVGTTVGEKELHLISYSRGSNKEVEQHIVEEVLACISVNGKELANFMCSPIGLEKLAIGFLFNEGIITSIKDVSTWHVSDKQCVDIWIEKEFSMPERLVVTSGCGGGFTFDDLSTKYPPIESDLKIDPDALAAIMKDVHQASKIYQRSGGIHTAALSDGEKILAHVEDLGRHNCIDKLAGISLIEEINLEDKILFSSGRISSEMINKARRMRIPIVCSRTSPTSLSVDLAKEWNMTIVGYLRQKNMKIYSVPERVLL